MKTIVCIASGPSLTQEDVDYCRGKALVYVVNNVFALAPWADVLYAADYTWWDYHQGVPSFEGARWTVADKAAARWGLNLIKGKSQIPWSNTPGVLATGGNSGFQTINKATLDGADRIVLLGYDYGFKANTPKHFFGEHPKELDKGSNFRRWVQKMNEAAPHIKVPVINCSRQSAINCFPRQNLMDVL